MKELRVIFKMYNNLLRERREATGRTACAFAVHARVHPTTYCEYERRFVSLALRPTTRGWSQTEVASE